MTQDHFQKLTVSLKLHISPIYCNNVKLGICEKLNSLLLRHDKSLSGIPVSYSNIELIDSAAEIYFDNPMMHIGIRVKFLTFIPCIGSKMTGIINHISADHIGMIIYGWVNGSISKTHLVSKYDWDSMQHAWLPSSQHHHKKKRKLASGHHQHNSSFTREPLQIGQEFKFRVLNYEIVNQMIAIYGTVKRHNDK